MINILTLLALNIVGFLIIYYILQRKLQRALSSTELLRQVESEIEAVITELNRTTERNITLVEDRIRSLAGMVEKADQRLKLMDKRADRETKAEPAVYTRPQRKTAPSETTVLFEDTVAEGPVAANGDISARRPVEKPMTQSEKVLSLHRGGLENSAIASRLGITLGEVDLIVSLGERSKG